MSDLLNQAQDGIEDEVDIPSEPGPALAGRTPAVGSIRRSQGFPVLRDELAEEMG